MSDMLLRRRVMMAQVIDPSRIIYYTTTNGSRITNANYFNTNPVLSNTYRNGIGKILFKNPVVILTENAFNSINYLRTIILPESVTSIGNYAFYGCSGLTSVSIPNSVTRIGNYAFESCSGLTSVTIPNSVTSIGYRVFNNCTGLKSVTIPNSVTSIAVDAFRNCTSLTSVVIPNSVTSISGTAFSYCNLTSIIVENGNSVYDSRDNCNAIIKTSANSLIVGCKNTIIPNSVTRIGTGSFQGCRSLNSLTIPSSVGYIDGSAFADCTGLTSITNYATTPQNTSVAVFNNVNKSTCILYVPSGSVGAYQTAYTWKDFVNILPIEE